MLPSQLSLFTLFASSALSAPIGSGNVVAADLMATPSQPFDPATHQLHKCKTERHNGCCKIIAIGNLRLNECDGTIVE
ncbi:hypothetical protein FRB94_001571 [Tulasnella sp. JGI-2019a]|nr:hypothetical protein FRB94_001571 [Tulasnella sp. JGI-2019a]KAG9000738.1 hypothetical protein FRB93_012564 [Tulasnella sp. JGI-2019a]KAG9031038.1 hypothetical protein FRB95_003203 [Tulasnella sp. JGI-2019a]